MLGADDSMYDNYYMYGSADFGSEYDLLDVMGLLSRYQGGVCVSLRSSDELTKGLKSNVSGSRWSFNSQYVTPKMTYSQGKGLFKGTIKIPVGPYCMYVELGSRSRMNKNVSLKVKGYRINGEFHGMATYKRFDTPIEGE